MDEESLKPNLFEMGTRWDHYNELRDLFASGVEVLKNLKVKSRGDQDRQAKLQHAVEMIEGRLNYITDYVRRTGWGSPDKFAIRDIVDREVGMLVTQMRITAREDAAKEGTNQANDDSEGPADYTTK